MNKKIIRLTVWKDYLEKEDNLIVLAEDKHEIVTGNSCVISSVYRNVITVKDNCIIKTRNCPVIIAGNKNLVFAGNRGTITCKDECFIKAKDETKIVCGDNCTIYLEGIDSDVLCCDNCTVFCEEGAVLNNIQYGKNCKIIDVSVFTDEEILALD